MGSATFCDYLRKGFFGVLGWVFLIVSFFVFVVVALMLSTKNVIQI